jgi:predicted acylesterase/phospholipase RssA
MSKPIPLQFAFQGGGARIMALLAVAEAIQDYEQAGRIRITRVAGTSAGSIVASLISAGIRADVVSAELRGGTGAQLLKKFKLPSTWRAVFTLLRNKPVWDTGPLRGWLASTFKKNGVVKLGDASKRIPLIITKTDLGSRACVLAQESDMIADAIMDSCALPYLFRIWNSTKVSTFVDGGISNNLPAAYLVESDPKHGELVAISFADVVTEHPDSIKSFSLALLDSAMSSTLSLIKETHRSNLMEVSTKIQTFDFAEALSEDYIEQYNGIKAWAKQQLDAKIAQIKEASRIAIADPWKETNPTAVNLMSLIGEAYNKSLATSRLHYESCRLIVYSNSGRPDNDPFSKMPDRAQFRFVFHSGPEPTYCISAGLVGQSDESTFAADSANCVVTDHLGKRLKFIKIPARTDQTGTRELCLFFTPPLSPNSGPYTVSFEENGENLMADLFKKNEDTLGYHPQRPAGPVKKVELALFVHKDIRVSLQSKDLNRPGKPLDWETLFDGSPIFPDVKGHAMVAENVDSLWVLDVIRRS